MTKTQIPKIKVSDMRDDQVMLALDLFVQNGFAVTPTSEAFNQKMLEHRENVYMTREQVYPAFRLAILRGFFRVCPPYDHSLAQRIVDRYGRNGPHERFRVSDIRVSTSRRNLQYVASNAADVVMELVQLLGITKERVHVGLGAGTTSMLFAQNFAQALRGERNLPKIALHALTAGFDALATERSPESFFGMFQQSGLNLDFYGMPAPPFVPSNEYQKALRNPAVRIPFEHKHEIDIVVTALASAHDPHGCMRRFIELGGRARPAWMDKVVGDIQYRLFSEKGPVKETSSLRAVTLFELSELRELARQDGKYVVLISGPCDVCGETREEALRPVMSNDDLKVWSHLVCDLDTAEKLVAPRWAA
jgi:DNA-binding transcriptional regulator LsrR (DeoR family)